MDLKTIPNFFTTEECDKFINLIINKSASKFTDSGQLTNKKWIDDELSNLLFNRLQELSYNEKYIKPNNIIMSGTYNHGDSFGLHTDTGLYYNIDENQKTKWTLLVYLNDNFTGGETVFYDSDTWDATISIKPEKGKALIFDIDLWHAGLEVQNGIKHWIGGEIIGLM